MEHWFHNCALTKLQALWEFFLINGKKNVAAWILGLDKSTIILMNTIVYNFKLNTKQKLISQGANEMRWKILESLITDFLWVFAS